MGSLRPLELGAHPQSRQHFGREEYAGEHRGKGQGIAQPAQPQAGLNPDVAPVQEPQIKDLEDQPHGHRKKEHPQKGAGLPPQPGPPGAAPQEPVQEQQERPPGKIVEPGDEGLHLQETAQDGGHPDSGGQGDLQGGKRASHGSMFPDVQVKIRAAGLT